MGVHGKDGPRRHDPEAGVEPQPQPEYLHPRRSQLGTQIPHAQGLLAPVPELPYPASQRHSERAAWRREQGSPAAAVFAVAGVGAEESFGLLAAGKQMIPPFRFISARMTPSPSEPSLAGNPETPIYLAGRLQQSGNCSSTYRTIETGADSPGWNSKRSRQVSTWRRWFQQGPGVGRLTPIFLNHFPGVQATKIAEQLRRAALASIHKSQMRCE
jgi:hypothetical protein